MNTGLFKCFIGNAPKEELDRILHISLCKEEPELIEEAKELCFRGVAKFLPFNSRSTIGFVNNISIILIPFYLVPTKLFCYYPILKELPLPQNTPIYNQHVL